MSDRVHLFSPVPWRARVDAHGYGLSSCARSELREHRLERPTQERAQEPVRCSSSSDSSIDSITRLSFARYLEQQNKEVPAAPCEPVPVHRHAPPAPVPRLDVPRLGDVPKTHRPRIDVRLRVIYRIEIPQRAGRVIDVLA
jgi:hypothetical protein